MIFTYKCTDCGTKNDTKAPPEDCMLHCSRCGFMTVQTCVGAAQDERQRKAKSTRAPSTIKRVP